MDLVEGNKIVPELQKIFEDWFEKFQNDGKLTSIELIEFIKKSTQIFENITNKDIRIKRILQDYDGGQKGYLVKDEFLAFYVDSALEQGKREIVWDNLRKMGIRNDLKKLNDEINVKPLEEDKSKFPRYCLSKDSEFFNSLEELFDISASVANEGSNFIYMLMTNSKIYQQILNIDTNIDKDGKVNWSSILDSKRISMFLYSLHIIESLIEDVSYGSAKVDSNDLDLALFEGDPNNYSIEDIRKIKVNWIKNFFMKGGLDYLLEVNMS